jgi:uncharacterized protein with von Willebrand factor type A (vWA) domain
MLNKSYHNSCLNTDSWDRRSFERLLSLSTKLQDTAEAGQNYLGNFTDLLGDQWNALYKQSPEVLPETELTQRARNNKPWLEQMMTSSEYEELRKNTTLNDLGSAIGTLSLGEQMVEKIKLKLEQDEELKKLQEEQEKLRKEQQKLENAVHKRSLEGKNPTKGQKDKLDQNQQARQQAQQQMQEKLASGMDMGQMMQQASSQAKETQDSLEDLTAGPAAGSGSGELQRIPLREQLELAEVLKMNRDFKKVAEWAGRFKRIARKKQKSKHTESNERSGVKIGNDIEKLLPSEIAAMKRPETKLDFMRRFVEGQTLQYSTEGKEELGKGPIVFCIDQSGSMSPSRSQSAGFALALAMIAKAQKRDFAFIPFAHHSERARTFKKGKIPPKEMVRIGTDFLGGGTDFNSPLNESLEVIKKSAFKNADIVFLTDGEASVNDDVLSRLEETKSKKKTRLMAVLMGSARQGTVETFADEIIMANDFMDAANSAVFEI